MFVTPNPDLGAERLVGGELGGDWDVARGARLSLTAFANQTFDRIEQTTIDETTRQRRNIGAAQAGGAEVQLSLRPLQELRLFAGYALTLSRISRFPERPELVGKQLPGTPVHSTSATLQWTRPELLDATVRVRAESRSFADDRNAFALPAFAMVDLTVSRHVWDQVELYASAENLLDAEVLTDRNQTIDRIGTRGPSGPASGWSTDEDETGAPHPGARVVSAGLAAPLVFEPEPAALVSVPARDPKLVVRASGTIYALVAERAPEGGLDARLYRSEDGGDRFGEPLTLNAVPGEVSSHGEAAPKLLLGPRSELYAFWVGKGALRFSRSTNYGKSFEPPVKLPVGSDLAPTFFTAEVSPDGALLVAWLGQLPAEATAPGTSLLLAASSSDRGATFSAPSVVARSVCPCCRPALAGAAKGTWFVAWRQVTEGQVRDLVAARSSDGGSAGAMRSRCRTTAGSCRAVPTPARRSRSPASRSTWRGSRKARVPAGCTGRARRSTRSPSLRGASSRAASPTPTTPLSRSRATRCSRRFRAATRRIARAGARSASPCVASRARTSRHCGCLAGRRARPTRSCSRPGPASGSWRGPPAERRVPGSSERAPGLHAETGPDLGLEPPEAPALQRALTGRPGDPLQLGRDRWLVDAACRDAHRELVEVLVVAEDSDPVQPKKVSAERGPTRLFPSTKG